MSRRGLVLAGLGIVAVVGVAVCLSWLPPAGQWPPGGPPAPRPLTDLRDVVPTRTAVVPTLDTPIPAGKSAIWCASFQMAWERLKADVLNGPVRLEGAEDAARHLNDAPTLEDAVEAQDVYTAGGWVRDGIVGKIKREMAGRFPGWEVPADLGDGAAAVAYAHLRAAVEFTVPLLDSSHPLKFKGADDRMSNVRSFGLPGSTTQVGGAGTAAAILHADGFKPFRQDVFVIDPCKDSSPYQLLLARVPRQATLALLVADVGRRIALGLNERERAFRLLDSLLVPDMRFRIDHRFTELERALLNPEAKGLTLSARQRIDFRLDRGGARLESRYVIQPKSDPRSFDCDGPFAVLMRKRGSTQPFLVLWVDNDELLEPWD